MTRVFWDVDTQVDFMRPQGRLYVAGAEAIAANLGRLTDCAHGTDVRIVASADKHDADDEEISDTPDFASTFPPHCLAGTDGQEKIAETALRNPLVVESEARPADTLARLAGHDGDILFNKRFFDVFTNPNVEPVVAALGVDEVVLYGVALDVCNRYAVEGLLARWPALSLSLVTDAVRAIDEDGRERLLADWRSRGVRMTTTSEVVTATL